MQNENIIDKIDTKLKLTEILHWFSKIFLHESYDLHQNYRHQNFQNHWIHLHYLHLRIDHRQIHHRQIHHHQIHRIHIRLFSTMVTIYSTFYTTREKRGSNNYSLFVSLQNDTTTYDRYTTNALKKR